MQATIKFRLLCCGIAASMIAALTGTAAEAATNSFEVLTVKEPMHGRAPVVRAYVTNGKKKFTFAVPDEFRLDLSNPAEVVLISRDFKSFITLRVSAITGDGKSTEAKTYRPAVLARFSETEIVEELSLSVAESTGPAFDLRGRTADGLTRMARVAYIPYDGRVLEFSLASSPDQFRASMSEFNSLMQTFRISNAGEKTEVATFSDRI